MPHVKSVAALGAVAMILCGCSAVVKPSQGRGRIDDQVTANNHLGCLLAHHIPARGVGQTTIQIGPLPAGATIQFQPTAGAAETRQIEGTAQGAEVIGSALLYPNHAPGAELTVIENCLAPGVVEPKQGVGA